MGQLFVMTEKSNMAEKDKEKAAERRATAQQFDDDERYEVALSRSVKLGQLVWHPNQRHVFTGKIIKELQADQDNKDVITVGNKVTDLF
jgi:hypothetical protein